MTDNTKNRNFSLLNVCGWIVSLFAALCAITFWPVGVHSILFLLCSVVINPFLLKISSKMVSNDKRKKFVIVQIVLFVLLFIIGAIICTCNNKNKQDKPNEVESIISQNKTENLEVYFLDVGQADCILIRQSQNNMLIDAGKEITGERLVSYLKSLGIEKFSYIVGTHPHEDHIGGLSKIIDAFEIEKIFMPNVVTTTTTFENVLDAVAKKKNFMTKAENSLTKKNLSLSIPIVGDKFSMGDCQFTVVSVGNDENDVNSSSIVLKLQFGEKAFLFTGDATVETEKRMLDKDIRADVLKVGHHGSSGSSSRDFLNKVQPSDAVISVGANNNYRHPSSKILDRLSNMGINIYRTDKLGTILATCDRENISISTVETNICDKHNIQDFSDFSTVSRKPIQDSENDDGKVFVVPKGKKYHKKYCSRLKKSKDVCMIDIDVAKEEGYSPCSVCKPEG